MLLKIINEDKNRSTEAANLRGEMIRNSEMGPALLNSGDITPWQASWEEWHTGPREDVKWPVPFQSN